VQEIMEWEAEPDERSFAKSDALKAAAYDLRKLADKHVEELRAQGLNEAEVQASEHDTTDVDDAE
jgi:hypothetical protein